MELKSEYRINAPREEVFAALNDPEILRQCIPGCESLDKKSDTEMSATVVLKIGPVKAKFKGEVELSNLVPPESYTITGKGSGGAAGFAKGGADIRLLEDGDGTLLQYKVNADVGGRLAQLGSRLVDSTARVLSGKFFTRFDELVAHGDDKKQPIETDMRDATTIANVAAPSRKPGIWIGTGVILLVVVAIALIWTRQ